ncbi:putative inverted ada-Golga3 fusion protein [Escherichia coli MP021017.5]|nr:putative inverted ada-Golga3 fusion protein [Escherichia coli MP021017.5]
MGDFIQPMLLGIGFFWLTTFAGAKASGECLAGIYVEGDVFPQSMSGAARRTAKDACGTHGENEFAVGIRVAG